MIRLAVFDIDRTLVSPEIGKIAPQTAAALKQLQANGVKTAIASGRLFSFLQPEIRKLGFDYYIMSNGGYVTDRAGNVLAQESIDRELLDAFSREMIRRNLPFDIRYCQGQRRGNPNCSVQQRMKPFWKKKKFRGRLPIAFRREYKPAKGELPICFCGFVPDGELEELTARFPGLDFLPVFESPMCDINPAGISKASGLQLVCNLTGIDIRDTIAFGDDRNDLELVAAAGIGVAMGNGLQAVKDVADYVTCDCEELGVVAGLRHFGLI